MANLKSCTVIGGGIIGLATAWKLLGRFPDCEVKVLEKEDGTGRHQSGNNSGVLHCGLYYKPGSFKARLAVSGIRQMVDFCEREGVPHEICGKLVVATDEIERERLEGLRERGMANGLRGIRTLERGEMLEREPSVGGIGALEVPEEGIVDYGAVCDALARKIRAAGGEILLGAEVEELVGEGGEWRIRGDSLETRSTFLVNCSGLHSDRVCRMSGIRPPARIVPFRGEYYELNGRGRELVNHLIYPVPDAAFPFLGVHFTRLIHGGVEAGPNAVLAFAREGYSRGKINGRDLVEAAFYPGLLRFVSRHPRMCLEELRQSLSRNQFCRALQKLVPSIAPDDLQKGGAGVRAQAMTRDGKLVDDFSFARAPGVVNVVNAPSPAATASLAIADEISNQIEND